MIVSPRFRDIFSARRLATRRSDRHAEPARREAITDVEFGRRADELEINMIWLEIAHAHQKAARAFTPDFLRAADLASEL